MKINQITKMAGSEKGNAVLSSIASIFLATLITLTTISLSFSAYHVLVIRDAAITAASKEALAKSPGRDKYLMKLLKDSLPLLATFEIEQFGNEKLVGVKVIANLPELGMLPSAGRYEVSVAATRENLL